MEARVVGAGNDHAARGEMRRVDHSRETAIVGQAATFAELYVRHRDQVFRLVRRHAHDDEEAADLTAGAFERAFARLDTYDARRGPILPWLLRIARNHAIDAIRRRRPVSALHAAATLADPAPDADPERRVLVAEAHADLGARLARLSLLEQEVLALRYGSDLTSGEIGQVIGKREAATQKLITRALARLREDLDGPNR